MKKLTYLLIAILSIYTFFAIAPVITACMLFIATGLIGYSILTKNKKTLQPIKVRAYKKY
jgi:hypothetical protein